MNAQEVFDTVATHLFTQGRPATEYGRCRYRTSDGLKCAVGCLIDDDKYFPGLEGLGAQSIQLGNVSPVIAEHNKLLRDLQFVHDSMMIGADAWDSTQAMRTALASVANLYQLSMTNVDTLSFKDR
jgi:hypothetical protein